MATEIKTPKSKKPSISKVRVVVRVRPFLRHEISHQNPSPLACATVLNPPFDSAQDVTVYLKDHETSRNECYKLDSFYDQDDNNVGTIFEKEVSPLIPGLFSGCNATVFAYGATGSGKTYTMQGGNEIPGLVHLAMSSILAMCQGTRSLVEMSYYEVYMDRCHDLLEPKAKEICVLDDKDGNIHLKGLSRVSIGSMSEFLEAFSCATHRQKVANTGLNDVSSRSHGVLVIAVSTPCDESSGSDVIGKLNLIDLAGNEDNRKTCNEGLRLQESAKINQSLFALSNVIHALNNNTSRVPYRESKLTRILQDSLGGRSCALMVACLNPGEYQESVYTVRLAARSRHISNFLPSAQKRETPVKVDMEAKLRSWLDSKGKTKSSQKFGAFDTAFVNRTPVSACRMKKLDSTAKLKATTSQSASNFKQRILTVPSNSICHHGGFRDPVLESSDTVETKAINPEFKAPSDELKSSECTPGPKASEFKFPDSIVSSPIDRKLEALQDSFRKILSPICSNIHIEKMSSSDQICLVLFDPKTPNTTHPCPNDMFQENATPLGKFTVRSSNLKNSLVEEYVAFLNAASKDELLELKGIGQKMADYIVELRESSPIKSLNDLEKIGLSTKQVNNMFGRAAKGLFN